VLVEKIPRVQSDVKKLFLLIRVADIESAKLRVATEVQIDTFILPSIALFYVLLFYPVRLCFMMMQMCFGKSLIFLPART